MFPCEQVFVVPRGLTESELPKVESKIVKSNASLYQSEVIKLLHMRKADGPLTRQDLVELQTQIQNLTMKYDDHSLYKCSPNLIKRLIQKDSPKRKAYPSRQIALQGPIPLRGNQSVQAELGD